MEEDLKILNDYLDENDKKFVKPKKLKFLQAIENLINKNKEQKRDIRDNHILIAKYSQKNEEQEKIIELMAEYIQSLISKYEDDTYTYTSIIDYFKKKAKGE